MRLDKIHEITENLSWDRYTWCSYQEQSLKKNSQNVTFLEVKILGYVQAFLFNYNKLFPVLKEIIPFKLCQHIVSGDWNNHNLQKQRIYAAQILRLPLQGFFFADKIFAWKKFTISRGSFIHGNHATGMQWDTNVTHHCTITCGWGVGWCIVLQFVKKSLQVFQWSPYIYVANNEFSLVCN